MLLFRFAIYFDICIRIVWYYLVVFIYFCLFFRKRGKTSLVRLPYDWPNVYLCLWLNLSQIFNAQHQEIHRLALAGFFFHFILLMVEFCGWFMYWTAFYHSCLKFGLEEQKTQWTLYTNTHSRKWYTQGIEIEEKKSEKKVISNAVRHVLTEAHTSHSSNMQSSFILCVFFYWVLLLLFLFHLNHFLLMKSNRR